MECISIGFGLFVAGIVLYMVGITLERYVNTKGDKKDV